ncbi:fimbria/pilus outer membrane usher protein [Burkholderia lata]|uniref:fimbria/pilus outer membrane usher protein n=1 Tax=Burkholderia lata (strain ATCC 17760 / DSM 23089 / LMG 22485 / NCIMB 9086 / R18194 / 383) TaxID=482957 RepID=UPI0014531BE3|nr:fimbria/pilus outer membrane usher protein [Burkholderia lata]VWL95355.1 fimbrial protein [Burkholderia lata]
MAVASVIASIAMTSGENAVADTAVAVVRDDKRSENADGSPAAGKTHFDDSMLMHGPRSEPIDTTPFERPNAVEPGLHRVELIVNGQWRGMEDITFHRDARDDVLPCYDRLLLQRAGVDLDRSARGQDGSQPPNPVPEGLICEAISRYVPGAALSFDAAEQKLYLTVPRFYMRYAGQSTYVDPANWTNGVPAAWLNYNASVFTTRSGGYESSQLYTGLSMAASAGQFRIRHNGNLTWTQRGGARYQRGYVYAQTDLPDWHAQLLAGESSTSGMLFDAVSFRGVQIASDDRMLPDEQRYYAPVVRGVAQSNAKVAIYQRGYLVHETTVAPGPFAIDNLQAMSYGGDLNVTVTEATGETRSFVVPFATAVQLLRPGSTRFSAMAGRAIDVGGGIGTQYVGQFTVQRGVSNALTAYGGAAFANRYQSVLMGVGLNTSIGGFAADVTIARTQPPGSERLTGSSIRVSYSKNLPNSGTNFSLLAYRYSTKGYLGLRDALLLNGRDDQGAATASFARLRNRVDLNVSQQIGRSGSVYANGSALSYWAGGGQSLSFTLGYSTQWRDATLTASVQRVRNLSARQPSFGGGAGSTLVSLNVSIPLGRNARRAPIFSTLMTHDTRAGTSATASLAGRFGEQSAGSYSLSSSYDGNNRAQSGSFGVGYQLPAVSLSANVGLGSDYQQASANATGGLVLHPGGLTPAPTLSETIGVVRAPHARGALVGNSNARVDRFGYAIVPSLTPYQLNKIDIDPKDIPDDVELKTVSRSVAPRSGSVVLLSYDTQRARALLIDAQTDDGRPLPFAARALDARTGTMLGAVGQGSRLLVRSADDDGQIRVEWGTRADQRCVIDYAVPAQERTARGYVTLTRVCRALPTIAPVAATARGQRVER